MWLLAQLICSTAIISNSEAQQVLSDDSCNQLVLYKPCPYLEPLRESTRRFKLGDKHWVIHQDWTGRGVAGVVWEAAIHMAEFLDSSEWRHLVQNKRVIELGAGTGLAGMVAAALGATCVELTDKNIDMTELNVQANSHNLSPGVVSVVQYTWGSPIPSSLLSAPFDVILGADIVYTGVQDAFPALVWSLKELSNPNTQITISSRHRYNELETFMNVLKQNGFESELLKGMNIVSIHRLRLIHE